MARRRGFKEGETVEIEESSSSEEETFSPVKEELVPETEVKPQVELDSQHEPQPEVLQEVSHNVVKHEFRRRNIPRFST